MSARSSFGFHEERALTAGRGALRKRFQHWSCLLVYKPLPISSPTALCFLPPSRHPFVSCLPMLPLWSILTTAASYIGATQTPFFASTSGPSHQGSPALTFRLRHLHGVADDSQIIFHDVPPAYSESSVHSISTRSLKVPKPRSHEDFVLARMRWRRKESDGKELGWDEDEVVAPNAEDRETLLELAKMTNNAYVEPGDPAWYNLTEKWNNVGSLP